MTLRLSTLLGDHDATRAVRSGAISGETFELVLSEITPPNRGFKRVVRDGAFDVAELAIVTLLMARERGADLAMLPAPVVARSQHPFLICRQDADIQSPSDLEGRRVGVRSWTVTTVMWLRAILTHQFGVSCDRIAWTTLEDAHVAGWADPSGVTRAPPGSDLVEMLSAGEIDAAILPGGETDPRFRSVIADPVSAARHWSETHNALQLNHVIVVRGALWRNHPEVVSELNDCLARGWAAAERGLHDKPSAPFGLDANRGNLELAVRLTLEQGLIERPIPVDSLLPPGLF